MEISHAAIDSYSFHYSFEGSNETLVISTPPTVIDGMMVALMFGWTPERKATVTRLNEDPQYGIGTQDVEPLAEFPFSAVISLVQKNEQIFKQDDLKRILIILSHAQSLAGHLSP